MAQLILRVTAPAGAASAPIKIGEEGGWIGRAGESEISLDDSTRTVSSRHARIDWDGKAFGLTDQSLNGTSLNGQRLARAERIPLGPGDEIGLGQFRLMVDDPAASKPLSAPSRPESAPGQTERFTLSLGDLIGPGAPPMPEPARRVLPAFGSPAPEAVSPTLPPLSPQPQFPEPAALAPTEAALLTAFWEGLGLGALDAPTPAVMEELGHALHEALAGAEALLRPAGAAPRDDARGNPLVEGLRGARQQLKSTQPRLAEHVRAAFAHNAARSAALQVAIEQSAHRLAETLSARAIEERLGSNVRARMPLLRRAELWRQFRALENELREAAENRFRKDLSERLRVEPKRLTFSRPADGPPAEPNGRL